MQLTYTFNIHHSSISNLIQILSLLNYYPLAYLFSSLLIDLSLSNAQSYIMYCIPSSKHTYYHMALIIMEDENSNESAVIIGLYELQKELAYILPNQLFHIELDYLKKCQYIIAYENTDEIQAIRVVKMLQIHWKEFVQDCYAALIDSLKQFNIEIQKSDKEKITYGEQYDRLDKIITEMIRPALMAHAGNIEIAYIKPHIIGLKLLGSCKGCPFSLQTLTMHVAKILGMYFPEFLIIHVTCITDWHPDMRNELVS